MEKDLPTESRERLRSNRILSLVEHDLFIGGSESVGSEIVNSKMIVEKFRSGGIPNEYLVPLVLVGEQKPRLEDVIDQRRQSYVGNVWTLWTPESAWEVDDEGYEPFIDLPEPNPETGIINPSWVLVLKNRATGSFETTQESLGKLSLREDLRELLTTTIQEDGLHITIRPQEEVTRAA